MPYTIVFIAGNTHDVLAADATTASEALAITEALQGQDSKIKFIRSPQEGEFGVEMLRLLAREEEEELRTALINDQSGFDQSERATRDKEKGRTWCRNTTSFFPSWRQPSFTKLSFAQENLGTPEQRAACSPDALRLCANDIPDPKKVENCLRQKKSKLSDQCRLVFEQSAGATAGRNKYDN